MPTLLRIGAYRLLSTATSEFGRWQKIWLNPVALASSTRFPSKDIGGLNKLLEANRKKRFEALNECFARSISPI